MLKRIGLESKALEASTSHIEINDVVDAVSGTEAHFPGEQDDTAVDNDMLDHLEKFSQTSESSDTSYKGDDGDSSEQSRMLGSLSDSSVACVTGDYAMQNVILRMGLRLLAPGGMQIRKLHRSISYSFSLPLPQGGREAMTKNPILSEDQLPHKFLYPKAKKAANKQEDDFFGSDAIFSHGTDKKTPHKPPVRQALAMFSGKRNPNDSHYSRSLHKL
ncbi:hypothetical protein Ancab_032645 [Ancistrocladus abbreviatus]